MTRNEYNLTSLIRTFTLQIEKIKANYKDGVLHLMLTKEDEAKKPLAMKNILVK